MKLREVMVKHAWWGKLIGAFMGWLIAGPVGALFGILVGNFFDRGLVEHFGHPPNAYHDEKRKNIQIKFVEITFSVLGKIAKADGRVSENEIRAAQSIMRELRLNHNQKKEAQNYFNLGKKANFNLKQTLMVLQEAMYDNPALLNLFINLQYKMAKVDEMTLKKQEIFNTILNAFGYAPLHQQYRFYEDFFNYEQFKHSYTSSQRSSNSSQHRPSYAYPNQLEYAYALLEISPAATKQEVKRAYRKLMSKHHPDKLMAKGMSEDLIKSANEKTQKIRKAYEQICETKGW